MSNTTNGSDPVFGSHLGLTKREYFAAVSLQGFISLSLDAETAKKAPAAAVNMADWLIEELNKVKS